MKLVEKSSATPAAPLVSGWYTLGLLALALPIGYLFSTPGSRAEPEACVPDRGTIAVSTPVRAVIVPVEGQTYVVGSCDGASQFVARDPEAWHKRQTLAAAEDALALAMMIRDGEVYVVRSQTPVEVIKAGSEVSQVRISHGVHQGKVGVVPTAALGVLPPRPQA